VNGCSELRLLQEAHSRCVAPSRHALRAFCEALGFGADALDDITTAVGEALANVVEHAYADDCDQRRSFELHARFDNGDLALEVADTGTFRHCVPRPYRGFGLRIIRAIAQQMTLDTDGGTRVRMRFTAKTPKS
jgi:anti-sigma regulatory factor (Ser/Thr protein kinase)